MCVPAAPLVILSCGTDSPGLRDTITQPVISANKAVKGTAQLLPTQELLHDSSACYRCPPPPNFLVFPAARIRLIPRCQCSCAALRSSIPAAPSLINSCCGPQQLAVGLHQTASELSARRVSALTGSPREAAINPVQAPHEPRRCAWCIVIWNHRRAA